jgi:hypothetical protein
VWLEWVYVWRNNVGDRGVVREEDERWIGGHKTPHKLEADMSSGPCPGSAKYLERAKKTCQENQCTLRIGLLPAIVCLFV